MKRFHLIIDKYILSSFFSIAPLIFENQILLIVIIFLSVHGIWQDIVFRKRIKLSDVISVRESSEWQRCDSSLQYVQTGKRNAEGLKRTRVVGTIHRNVRDSIRGITVKTPQGERAADWTLPPASVRKINRILLRANPGPFIRGSANTLSFVRNSELMMIATRLRPNESHARPPSHRHPAAAPSRPPYAALLVYFNAIINGTRLHHSSRFFSLVAETCFHFSARAQPGTCEEHVRAFVRQPNAWSNRSSNRSGCLGWLTRRLFTFSE